MNLNDFPAKKIRAKVIKEYLRRANKLNSQVVCLSCGNASKALIDEGLNVVDLSPNGKLIANRWLSQSDVARIFPDAFDATSGHLHFGLMWEIAMEFKKQFGGMYDKINVPSGSGETAVCIALAYPKTKVVACYHDCFPETKWNDGAPLNELVKRLCDMQRITKSE